MLFRSYAIAKSNTDIARGSDRWARRNKIYYCADTETADLVAFPNKCDVIGCGSYDANSKPGITGNHVPVNAGNYGTRFINVRFNAPADASPIVTLASSSTGIQFIDCTFLPTATTTIGIQSTASHHLVIKDCTLYGPFVTAAISILAGEAGATLIENNLITGSAAVGILTDASTTTSWISAIRRNLIHATTICLNEASDLFLVVDNDFVSLAAVTGYATPAESLVCNAALSSRNYLTASNVNFAWPIADTTT